MKIMKGNTDPRLEVIIYLLKYSGFLITLLIIWGVGIRGNIYLALGKVIFQFESLKREMTKEDWRFCLWVIIIATVFSILIYLFIYLLIDSLITSPSVEAAQSVAVPEIEADIPGSSNPPIHSPLDQFAVLPFLRLKIGGGRSGYFSFTNASFFLGGSLGLFLLFNNIVTKLVYLVPNYYQFSLESLFSFVLNLVKEQIGGLSGNVKQRFFPCISVTFTFSLVRNLQGMIPYSFTVTSHFCVTLGLSFSIFIGITIVGFASNGIHFLSISLPAGVPLPLAPFLVLLELISYSFRALSLGIRLFANMMAGHSLVKIISGFAWTMICMNDLIFAIGSTVPFLIVMALTGLELGVAILQAYVFTILMCIYLNDAIHLH